ncbi:unnamed protein product, partial [Didymodactylos carnosus]
QHKDIEGEIIFDQLTTIHGKNGAGKSTLTLVFRSLKDNNQIALEKRKSLLSETTDGMYAHIIDEDKNWYTYEASTLVQLPTGWDKSYSNIVLFDREFIKEITKHLSGNSGKREMWNPLCEQSNDALKQLVEKQHEIYVKTDEVEQTAFRHAFAGRDPQIAINNFLHDFNSILRINRIDLTSEPFWSLRLTEPEYDNLIRDYLRVSFGVTDNGTPMTQLEHLNEGDRRALALSFFLADLEIGNNYSNKIVVMDDPVTSFDSEKKFITLAVMKDLLRNVNRKVKQLIVLSHDADLLDELISSVQPIIPYAPVQFSRLEIYRNIDTDNSILRNREVRVGYERVLDRLREYAKNPENLSEKKRAALSHIRLVLETDLKTKFDWLIQTFHRSIQPKMFGKLVEMLKNHNITCGNKNQPFIIHPHLVRYLFNFASEVSKHLHGSRITVPGELTDSDVEKWRKEDLCILVKRALILHDQLIRDPLKDIFGLSFNLEPERNREYKFPLYHSET